jgi:hypothetical protein
MSSRFREIEKIQPFLNSRDESGLIEFTLHSTDTLIATFHSLGENRDQFAMAINNLITVYCEAILNNVEVDVPFNLIINLDEVEQEAKRDVDMKKKMSLNKMFAIVAELLTNQDLSYPYIVTTKSWFAVSQTHLNHKIVASLDAARQYVDLQMGDTKHLET